MLDKMRSHRSNQLLKIFVYGAFGIIIVVFAISFGPGSWGQATGASVERAAVVDGNIITAVELERQFANYAERYRQITGNGLTNEQAAAEGVREKILDSLVDRELVAEAARRNGIQVADAELAKTIRDIPGFQENGRFDADLYRRYVMNVLGSTPGKFEAGLRKDLLQEKALQALDQSVKVAPDEVRARYMEENDKIDLSYVRISPLQFQKTVEPTEAQIQEVLGTRKDEVAQYYERNKWRYERPKRVRASQILVSVPRDADDAARAEARQEAEGLLAKVTAGEDFAELARAHSDDEGSKENGGDLNWFGPGTMAPPIEAAAFGREAGEVHPELVQTDLGFHLLKVTDVQPAVSRTLEDVQTEIAAQLVQDGAAETVAKAKAEELLAQAKGGKTLQELAPPPPADDDPANPAPRDPSLLVASQTGLVAITGGYIPGIGRDAALAAKLKALTPEAPLLPEVARVGESFYIVRLVEREAPDMEKFAAEAEALTERMKAARQRDVRTEWVRSLRDSARVEVNEMLVASVQ